MVPSPSSLSKKPQGQKGSSPLQAPVGPQTNKFTRINRGYSEQFQGCSTRKHQRRDCIPIIIIAQLSGRQIRAFSDPVLSLKSDSSKQPKKQTPGNKKKLRFSREENLILSLDSSLQNLRRQKSLDEKSVQIKYVNTLKKIKAVSGLLGCKVRVQSSGFTLQNTKERHSQQEQAFSYSFGKQFNRYFKRKLVQKLAACETANLSLHNAMGREVEQMQDTIKLNKNSHQYRSFTSHRMQTYLRGVSTEQKKMPFAVKQGIDSTFEKIALIKEVPSLVSRKASEVKQNGEGVSPLESPTNRGSNGSKNSTSTRWTLLLGEFQADISQFEEICDFFERIQHELLRYMPNNHLSNKINNIIAQVEHSAAIRRIYDQCNADVSQLTPQRIVRYLRKEEGILSAMNYIVNVIKLNISAERRKRFLDLEKVIGKYQKMAVASVADIADRLKKVGSPSIKRSLDQALKRTDTSCRGMDPSYLSFVRQAEEQEFSSINAAKNRNIICEILKFESLMK